MPSLKLQIHFLEYLAENRRYSEHTISAYRRDLTQFCEFIKIHMGEEINSQLLKNLTKQDVQAFLAKRKLENKCSATTLNRQIATLKSWFKWLRQQGIKNDSIRTLRSLKTSPPAPKALSKNDTWDLLEATAPPTVAPQNIKWQQRRNFALIITLYGLGLRISEALALKRKDIKFGQLKILGKGGKERVIPIPIAVQSALDSWIKSQTHLPDTHPLFANNKDQALGARSAQKIIKKLRRDLNLPEHLTPHALRHTFATQLLANGADLRSVQELLGHSQLSTTQRYLATDIKSLIATHNKAHPLEK